ncbi:MAG: tetratricopeptide repeat protein [Dermatophilaceae bacterium]|nr:tetratricopeptide repeat protein [Dermatophilaceae bacterium]
MKSSQRSTSVPGKRSSWVLRLGVLVLVVGVAAFGFIYYQDQHVDAGPSLIGRQTAAAEAAVKKQPNSIAARLALAASYRSVKRLDDAIVQYDEVLKADKGNRFALLGRGDSLIAKGDLTAAAATYRKITTAGTKGEFAAADPQLEEARYYLGSILVKQGKTKEAIKELQAALRIQSSDSDALYLLGVAQLKEGATLPAIGSLQQALRFVPTGWCEPYSQLTVAYKKLGSASQATYAGAMADFCHKKPVEAKRRLTTLLTGQMKVDAMLGLAQMAETENNNPEATSWFKKVLAVDRTNVTAMTGLSRLGVGPATRSMSSSTTQGPS